MGVDGNQIIKVGGLLYVCAYQKVREYTLMRTEVVCLSNGLMKPVCTDALCMRHKCILCM